MKRVLSIMLIPCFLTFSCKKIDKSVVIIEGENFNRNIKKVYLQDAIKWETVLDSADCINGKFKLNYKPAVSFEPFLAILTYKDKNNIDKSFYVRNEELIKKDGKNHSSSSFMLDYGITKFIPFNLQKPDNSVNVEGGKEQKLYQKYDPLNFGYVPKARTEARKNRFSNVVEIIRDNPYSFYLLKCIIQYRERYAKDELKKLLACFEADVRNSGLGKKLQQHITNTPNSGENTKALSLISNLGIRKNNINSTAKLNMLIFWASWCGPCRDEIPQLKKLYKMIKTDDFYMASISTDKNKNDWKIAMEQESMNWDQFIIEQNDKDKIMSQYAFSAIPVVIFTNKQGKELGRFVGYNPLNFDTYKSLIGAKLRIELE